MSLRRHGFRTHAGPWTHSFSRPLVIARYNLSRVFSSRLFTIFYVACFLPSCLSMVSIYLRYRLETWAGFTGTAWQEITAADFLDDWLYYGILQPSEWVVFVIVLVVGPSLLAPDLKDNAMPLYLSRPVTKLQYLLGKFLVLLWLTAAVTWIPGLLLVLTNAYYAEDGWLLNNLSVPLGLVGGCLVWTACLSMIALAFSAWVAMAPRSDSGLPGAVRHRLGNRQPVPSHQRGLVRQPDHPMGRHRRGGTGPLRGQSIRGDAVAMGLGYVGRHHGARFLGAAASHSRLRGGALNTRPLRGRPRLRWRGISTRRCRSLARYIERFIHA